MKRTLTHVLALSAALSLAGTAAFAQGRSGQQEPQTQSAPSGSQSQQMSQQSGQHTLRASKLNDAKIQDQQGKSLGEIQDVLMNPQTGQASFVILSGSQLGHSGKFIAIPFQLLQQKDEKTFTINVDQQQLKSAPTVEKEQWQSGTQTDWQQKVYQHFGVSPQGGGGTLSQPPSSSGGASGGASGSSSSGTQQ